MDKEMIKVILFDCDGPIVKRDKYFSQRLLDIGVELNMDKVRDFFNNEFLLCETGKADLKEELSKRIGEWGWQKSLQELLDFWFEGEKTTDPQMVEYISKLPKKNIKKYMTTDQEKYRTEYLLNIVGLGQLFEGVYSSCEVGFLKRDVNFWKKVHEGIGNVPAKYVVVLDDDQKGLDAAQTLGFHTEFYTSFPDFKQIMEKKYSL